LWASAFSIRLEAARQLSGYVLVVCHHLVSSKNLGSLPMEGQRGAERRPKQRDGGNSSDSRTSRVTDDPHLEDFASRPRQAERHTRRPTVMAKSHWRVVWLLSPALTRLKDERQHFVRLRSTKSTFSGVTFDRSVIFSFMK